MTSEEFGQSYASGYMKTVRWLVKLGLKVDHAEELAQQSWTRGYEKLDQIKDPSMIVAWVNSIAINFDRSNHRRPINKIITYTSILPNQSHHDNLDNSIDDSINTKDAYQALQMIDNHEVRDTLIRYYLRDQSVAEISVINYCPESTVRVRLSRGRQQLSHNFKLIQSRRLHARSTQVQTRT